MTPRFANPLRPDRTTLGMRWLVLMVILLGIFVSSMGVTNSHGISAITATSHAAPLHADAMRGHVHEHAPEHTAAGAPIASQVTIDDHPHHGADHSHDMAHAPRPGWRSTAPLPPAQVGIVRPWIEWVQAFRLERPPMG